MTIVLPKSLNRLQDLKIDNHVLKAFDSLLLNFVSDISILLLKKREIRIYPELIALGFWMRKSHLKEIQTSFETKKRDSILIGRGTVFHLAPSNVDTIFVYSWFLSLLVGNNNILRISDKDNIQIELLLKIISDVLYQEKYKTLQSKIAIIRYGHDDEITKFLSLKADIRVIWGGDNTIKHMRTLPISATTSEMTFADKFSFSIINSTDILSLNQDKLFSLIHQFYNDAYTFSQMACSSVRMVVWIGDNSNNAKAQTIFWNALEKLLMDKHPEETSGADVINKLVAECSIAINNDVNIKKSSTYINRIKIKTIQNLPTDIHCGNGLFYELYSDSFQAILPFMNKKYQTISYFGFSKKYLADIVSQTLPRGIDRIIPIGKALDFSQTWDGYDMIRNFCREIEIL